MLVQSALDIGKLVANARAQQKITQSQLARATGTSQNWVSEVEAGKPTAQIGKVLSVLSYLGVRLQIAAPSRANLPATRDESDVHVSLGDIIEAHSTPRKKRPKARR
jgi:y4mF family transcriptional regulator